MNQSEWLKLAKEHRQEMLSLISDYHPVNRSIQFVPPEAESDLNVTAEQECQRIRRMIRAKWANGGPNFEFMRALDEDNMMKAYIILTEVWFGIPESASYVSKLPGFPELAKLLEFVFDSQPKLADVVRNRG